MKKMKSSRSPRKVADDFTELLRCVIAGEKASAQLQSVNSPVVYDDSIFSGACQSEAELKCQLGKRYFLRHLTLLGSLCEMFKYATSRHRVTVLNISTTGSNMLAVFKSPMVVSRLLKMSDKVGLTKIVGAKFRFNCRDSYCRKRAWNKAVQDLVCGLVDKYDLNNVVKEKVSASNIDEAAVIPVGDVCDADVVDAVGDVGAEPVSDGPDAEEGDAEKDIEKDYGVDFVKNHYYVDLSAKLMIGHCSDETALQIIHDKYPQIRDYQLLADQMNANLDEINKIHFNLNLRRSRKGYITRIGIRATNRACQFHSKENALKRGEDVSSYDGVWREEYLNWYFKKHNVVRWMEFDQKASIYYISNFKWNGKFETGDMYEKMFGCKLSDEQRSLFKLCFAMRAAFDVSAKAVYCKLKDRLGDFDATHSDKAVVNENGEVEPYSLQLIRQYYNRVQQVMHNPRKNTSIFLDESCTYMDVVNHIRKFGYVVVQVYDAFYIGSKNGYLPTKEQVQNVINHFTKSYFERYCKSSSSSPSNPLHS